MDNYKEKYEKALEKAREVYNNPNASESGKKLLEGMFGELRESEDERTRKEIEYIIRAYRDSCIYEGSHKFDDCLAWLEKQGEKSLSTEEKLDYNDDFNEAVSQKIRNMVSKLFSCDDTVTSKEFSDHFAWELLQLAKAQVRKEQKPDWSEEDEEIIEALNDYVKNLDVFFSEIKIGDKDILSKEFREKIQHWLKSIKDRVQPQPKQEWSEEDEKMLNSAIYFVNNYRYDEVCGDGSIFTDCFYTSKVVDWLKSIKNKVQPKPKQEWSEEDEHYKTE